MFVILFIIISKIEDGESILFEFIKLKCLQEKVAYYVKPTLLIRFIIIYIYIYRHIISTHLTNFIFQKIK